MHDEVQVQEGANEGCGGEREAARLLPSRRLVLRVSSGDLGRQGRSDGTARSARVLVPGTPGAWVAAHSAECQTRAASGSGRNELPPRLGSMVLGNWSLDCQHPQGSGQPSAHGRPADNYARRAPAGAERKLGNICRVGCTKRFGRGRAQWPIACTCPQIMDLSSWP